MIRSDIRTFFRRLPGLFRNDYSAVMLVIANLYPVIDMLWKGEPIGSILVIYWIQMMIIGFWNIPKLMVIGRWRALLFFATHGLSFWENFTGGREYEKIAWDTQLGKPILRAMPMWLAALVGGIIGGFFNTAAVAVLFVLPVKLSLDLLGHFAEHGMLGFDDDEAQGSSQQSKSE